SAIEEVGCQGVVSLVITEVGDGVRVISQPHVGSSEDGCGRPYTDEAEGPITVRVSHLSHRPVAALGGGGSPLEGGVQPSPDAVIDPQALLSADVQVRPHTSQEVVGSLI